MQRCPSGRGSGGALPVRERRSCAARRGARRNAAQFSSRFPRAIPEFAQDFGLAPRLALPPCRRPRRGNARRGAPPDARDYDVRYYVRVLRESFAARFARALDREDFEAAFADPEQPSLFDPNLHAARPVLTVVARPAG